LPCGDEDAEADAERRLVAATNVRRVAAHLGISKDTAARALARLGDAGLLGRGSALRQNGRFPASAYVVRLGDSSGITLLPGRFCPEDPCPVVAGHGRRPGQRGYRPLGEAPFVPVSVIPTPADAGGASFAVPGGRPARGCPVMGVAHLVEPASVVAEVRIQFVVDHDDRTVPGHHDHALTAQHLSEPEPARVRTQQLTTTPAASLDRAHDALTSTVHNASDDHPKKRFRHWHPAVPFPAAAVTGAAEAAKAAPC
jgi:hypothetical protein